jgi:hypothetical protein
MSRCRPLIAALAPALFVLAACSANLDFDQFEPKTLPPDATTKTDGGQVIDAPTADQRLDDAQADLADGPMVDAFVPPDAPPGACTSGKDSDGDTIPDLDEGCGTSKDSDGDKLPDFLDPDSDNDKIPDSIEAGDADPKTPPPDTDGDGFPDTIDGDSDNDGVLDMVEDYNGDGHLGCCRDTCGEVVAGCPTVAVDACGPGQTCSGGACAPKAALLCARGESDRTSKDTYGLGTDLNLGNTICSPSSKQNPFGLKALQLRSDTGGDWTVAMETVTKYTALTLGGASKQAAAVMNHDQQTTKVAGFVVSRASSALSATAESSAVVQSILTMFMGSTETTTLLASGTPGESHDGFKRVTLTTFQIAPKTGATVSTARDALVAQLLNTTVGKLTGLPAPIGTYTSKLILRLGTLLRKDGRVIFIGAVTEQAADSSFASDARLVALDLANGTALAQAGAGTTGKTTSSHCESMQLPKSKPMVDIVWVIDESGSMNNNRKDIGNNANALFAYALSAGLDFRMGVTNVCSPNGAYRTEVGKFCSSASTVSTHDGGADRFLLPSEQSTFSACINNPPGYEGGAEYGLVNIGEAVLRHLPRAKNAPDKIRTDAKLVVIMVTDEMPQSLQKSPPGLTATSKTCALNAANQGTVDGYVKPYIDLLSGKLKPEAKSVVHVIGGVCNSSCGAHVAHGYKELAIARSGQVMDVCQKNLQTSLTLLFDDIIAESSPFQLVDVPISASLKVAHKGKIIQRSRYLGFAYNAAANAIWFSSAVQVQKGDVVVVSYKRWKN